MYLAKHKSVGMRTRCRKTLTLLILLSLTLFVLPACEVIDFIVGPPISAPSFDMVGKSENELIIAIGKTSDGATVSPYAENTQTVDILSIDLASGASVQIISGITIRRSSLSNSTNSTDLTVRRTTFNNSIMGNTRWIAWMAQGQSGLTVFDRSSNVTLDLDELEPVGEFIINGLVENRVVLKEQCYGLGPCTFVVLDLENEILTTIPNSLGYGAFAISSDSFALFNSLPNNAKIIEFEIGTNLDMVDLSTGRRQTVAKDLRVHGNGGDLFPTTKGFVWQQFKNGSFRSTVSEYDIETSSIERLPDPMLSSNDGLSLMDTSDDRLLFATFVDSLRPPVRFTVLSLDGEESVIADVPMMSYSTFSEADVRVVNPLLIGNYVVWSDWVAQEIVVINLGSKVTTLIDPTTSVLP